MPGLMKKIFAATRSSALSGISDVVLAGLVVGIVAMMIIPLPTFLLDILLTTNISLSVVLLLVCIYVSDALRIATLPSILLITTLFRLGLNVSSTRLILLQADAGEVIQSFGEFVVAGNLVVGGVIFLILTLIQFVVIAKGSERVAEVAARFTLDAMPGKQMTIDADMRAGAIDLDEARRLRAALQRESQLYGSMDGAMKFVKGDAVAGILITLINIVGGLLIGVLQQGLPAGEALSIYAILTIGDGLVSQIPALLISTAAGIVVTRVASEDEGAHLGQDIGEQILSQPRALGLAAGLLALLALVPGLPALPFLLLAVIMGLLAYTRLRAKAEQVSAPQRNALEKPSQEMTLLAPIALEVGRALTPLIDATSDGGRLIQELIPGLRELLYTELGVPLPGVRVRGEVASLPPNGYRILLSEIPMGSGLVPADRLLVLALAEELRAEGLSGLTEENLPGVRGPLCGVPPSARPLLQRLGLEIVDPPTQMVLHLGQVLKAYAYEFVGIQETQRLLDTLEAQSPALVHEVVPKKISLPCLAEVLRRLVEEWISIRALRDILQALAEWGSPERDPVILTEHVRTALSRYITHKYADEGHTLRAFLLDPLIEQTVRDAIQKTTSGSYLALEPELSRDIVQAVRGQLRLYPEGEPLPAVLTQVDIRRYVRRLLEVDFPELPVLSHTELLPQLKIQPVARISVAAPI
jgi:type III secretion protein V